MIRTLLATTALAVALGGLPRPAAAQSGPGLATFDFAQATNALATVQKLKDQWETLKSSLSTMQSTLTTTESLWSVAQHGNSALSVAPGLSSLASQMPGSSSGWVPSMTFGSTSVGTQAQQFFNQNHVANPQGTDFASQEIQRRQQATANMQAEVMTGLQASDERITMLGQLESDIPNNNDAVFLAAAQARILSEQAFLANEQTKVARLQIMQNTQAQVDQQRAEQNERQQLSDMHAQAAAAAGW